MATTITTLDKLVERLASLEKTVDELQSKQEIAEVLFRASRGVDRGDADLLNSCFHPGGTDYRGIANGPAENCQNVLRQFGPTATQHPLSNILIDLDGDVAQVESLCYAFHHIAEANDGKGQDEHVRARYLDRFERRGGTWKIVRRITLWDWTAIAPSGPSWIEAVPPEMNPYFVYGRRDKQDVAYTFALPDDLRHHEPDAVG